MGRFTRPSKKAPITTLHGDPDVATRFYSDEALEDVMIDCEVYLQSVAYTKEAEIDCATWYNAAEEELDLRAEIADVAYEAIKEVEANERAEIPQFLKDEITDNVEEELRKKTNQRIQ